ncbi:hypothetical protein EON79_13095 [bacterium]|nr:MAG: hypothetical protein EON79_13095 [bacterium]
MGFLTFGGIFLAGRSIIQGLHADDDPEYYEKLPSDEKAKNAAARAMIDWVSAKMEKNPKALGFVKAPPGWEEMWDVDLEKVVGVKRLYSGRGTLKMDGRTIDLKCTAFVRTPIAQNPVGEGAFCRLIEAP